MRPGTSAVCAEVALVVPPAFVALTGAPRCPDVVGVEGVGAPSAPESAEHAEPDPSQRCHAYAYDVGEPLQVPVVALSTRPSCAVPDTTGADTLTGAAAGITVAVATEDALADPPAFDAVTKTRTVEPTSVLVSTYVVPVAPESASQSAPVSSQRCHSYPYDVGEPLQVPVVALST